MKVLILTDNIGQPWPEFTISYSVDGDMSETFYRKAAEEKLAKRFADYWLSGRFTHMPSDFVKQFRAMLIDNGWKFAQYEVTDNA